MRIFRGIFSALGIVMCSLMCTIFLAFIPLQTTFASENNDDFDAFHAALMSMITNYDDEDACLDEDEYRVEDGQVFVSEKAVKKYGLTKTEGVHIFSGQSALEESQGGQKTAKMISQDFFAVENLKEEDGRVVVDSYINRLIVNSPEKVDNFGASAEANFKDWHIFQYDSHEQAQKAYEELSNSNLQVSFDFVVSASDPIEEDVSENASSSLESPHNSWGAEYVGYDAFAETTFAMHEKSSLPEIVVAVIDSGIYRDHQLFAGRILTDKAENFSNDDKKLTQYDYQDLNGHGTHVSGTIAEFTPSNVKILPLKVLNQEGKGYGSMIVAALEKVVELKNQNVNIKVANMSLGIDLSKNELLSGYPELTTAVQDAKDAGVATVVSAGNESRNTRYSTPASIPDAITVSALQLVSNQFGGDNLKFDESYSNFGSHVDFSAPGTHIKSASKLAPNAYVYMSGTSMAAPHVSAAVALLISNPFYQDYSVDEIVELLSQYAVDIGDAGRDDLYGYGCINLAEIGVEQSGNVIFSETEKLQTAPFELSLEFVQTENVDIYYTFGKAEEVDATNGKLYERPFQISESTQVTAMGYFKDYNQKKLQKSFVSTMTYYFNNMDLLSNYDFRSVGSGYEISNYLGKDLTTLNVPKLYQDRSVVGIGAHAFDDSNVKTLNLPQTMPSSSALI